MYNVIYLYLEKLKGLRRQMCLFFLLQSEL